MLITRKSSLTGIERTKEIDITREQLVEWEKGALIQDVAPYLSSDDREFLMTGIVESEWNDAFGGD